MKIFLISLMISSAVWSQETDKEKRLKQWDIKKLDEYRIQVELIQETYNKMTEAEKAKIETKQAYKGN